jgi:phosphoglycerate dehydrogenase-like enzyme
VTTRVVNGFGFGDALRRRLDEAAIDVDLVDCAGDPPDGLRAQVFFGGYHDWDRIVRWLDATGVEWVQLSGTGVDKVPLAAFDGRVVTCARGASAEPISEWVLATILARAKRFPDVFLDEPPKYWNFPDPTLDAVAGSTLALVGLGGIGCAIATRALPFGMRVKAMRRTDAPSPVPGVEVVTTLDELLDDADHLVLAAPATTRTRHLLDTAAFAKAKPGLHLVNIARGSLVDQDALRAALDDGRVAVASLDTVDPEPLPAGHWMYEHPQVRLSAHVSWYSPALQRAALEIFVDNLVRYLRDEPLQFVVDPAEGY